jgi:glucose-1-phosphate thymidylyltransferase
MLPVYDKPMIYYPLSTLMMAGIRDILIISNPEHVPAFKNLLGDGEALGIKLSYCAQPQPGGLAQAFILGEDFIGDSNVCLVLGDNIFYGANLSQQLLSAAALKEGGVIFGCMVDDPHRYGIAEISKDGRVISIEEKPKHPKSKYAVTGLYFYDNQVVEIAKSIKPSARGELEITDVNNVYLEKGKLTIDILGSGTAWFDTGTHQSLLEASQFIASIEKRHGFKISCLEEIAFKNGYINKDQLMLSYIKLAKSEYGLYLQKIIMELAA